MKLTLKKCGIKLTFKKRNQNHLQKNKSNFKSPFEGMKEDLDKCRIIPCFLMEQSGMTPLIPIKFLAGYFRGTQFTYPNIHVK